ncbi:hypothetical protein [Metamycoplasma hyosynoviae]|uniref:hypothetical protein n=1 Tax=Metamycoplasma hyosynoviae TaxID=29559 RepID=UPI002365BE7B|nr:hypothetical protein [Metamycoplasma hyosynoviae]MDD7884040.1 hypothetical protein [Metamycoplasma hyosynoviae]
MNKNRIKEIFDKHFQSIGVSLKRKIIDKEESTFDIFYHSPLSDNDLISGSIFNTCNIRYGDFLEEIINEFLSENGVIISPEKKKGNYDLLFEYNNTLYVGEIKIRDNHDSTKKKGQIRNLIDKVSFQKQKNPDKKVIAIIYFIDHFDKKNKNFYEDELRKCVKSNTFDGAKIFYGDEIFVEFNLQNKWEIIKKDVINFNKQAKELNYIKQIIINYLNKVVEDEKEDYDRVLEIVKKLKSRD